jgi:hypothetical protein
MTPTKRKIFRALLQLVAWADRKADQATELCEALLHVYPKPEPRKGPYIQSTVWPAGRKPQP